MEGGRGELAELGPGVAGLGRGGGHKGVGFLLFAAAPTEGGYGHPYAEDCGGNGAREEAKKDEDVEAHTEGTPKESRTNKNHRQNGKCARTGA